MPPKIQQLIVRKLADKSEGERIATLVLPKDAVVADENGDVIIDQSALERRLVNPATPGIEHEPWPFAGIEIADPPRRTLVSQRYLQQAQAEGWVKLVGEKVAHEPGGPEADPWRVTHTFIQADKVVFKTVDGDLIYKVARSPGKYDDGEDGKVVHWDYELELVSG